MAKRIAESTLGAPPDTYLYTLAQATDTFATIGSDDTLRLFDASLKFVQKVTAAHNGMSCLASISDTFVTAGRDGIVRFWDRRAQRSNIQMSEPKRTGFSAIACHEHIVAAGTESTKEGLGDVSVLLYDTRNPAAPIRSYGESHTDTITQLAFHPEQPNILLSGSTDGLVSIFDANQAEEEDAIQQVFNPRSAVHCAGFLNSKKVYVVTTDEQFSIYSLGDLDQSSNDDVIDHGDVREKLDCMYVVDIVNHPSKPAMIYGHNVNQTLSIAPLDTANSWSFGKPVDLPGAHGEEVVRDVLLLPGSVTAFTCGEDGHVRAWSLP